MFNLFKKSPPIPRRVNVGKTTVTLIPFKGKKYTKVYIGYILQDHVGDWNATSTTLALTAIREQSRNRLYWINSRECVNSDLIKKVTFKTEDYFMEVR